MFQVETSILGVLVQYNWPHLNFPCSQANSTVVFILPRPWLNMPLKLNPPSTCYKGGGKLMAFSTHNLNKEKL